jgi:DNA-binding CsgD family transcriptional regulator
VVDTASAEQLGYDPVAAVSLLAQLHCPAPRHLVAVVMRGLTAEFVDAPMAFAVEMHDLWDRNRPILAVEEAALYYLEKPNYLKEPATPEAGEDPKKQSISQEPRWGNIAARAVRIARGEIIPAVPVVPPLTRNLVAAMCATRKDESAPYLSERQREILFYLARQRRTPRDIAAELKVTENYVRRQQAAIVTTLSPYVGGPADAGQSANGAFCDDLVNRYGSWLLSRSVRVAWSTGGPSRQ